MSIDTSKTVVNGKHNSAKIMTDIVEEKALEQVQELANLKALESSKMVFMPDIHYGKGTNIGTTIKFDSLEDMKVNPEWVGNDIACSVSVFRLGDKDEVDLDFDKLDKLAAELHKPVGHAEAKMWVDEEEYTEFFSKNVYKKAVKNLGRISGGNHMAEVGEMDGSYYLTIHNGSLFLGQQVYKHYMDRVAKNKVEREVFIEELRKQEKPHMIQPVLELLSQLEKEDERDRKYLNKRDLKDYIEAVEMCHDYAFSNHCVVADRFYKALGIEESAANSLRLSYAGDRDALRHSVHNYVDKHNFTVYKGAASAKKGEDVIIPINMRDGVIVGKGLGNPDWNEAAPHGAGRLMSRTQAKKNIKLDTYLEQLKGVRSISINENTLDEAPDAYKSIEYILERIEDTVEVTGVIKPVYNFKVAEEEPHWMRKRKGNK